MSPSVGSAGDWQRVEELFFQALELPVDERTAFLDRSCGGDPALRIGIQDLLDADEGAEIVVEGGMAAAFDGFGLDPSSEEEHMPERVGPYRIVREVGRGGAGTVYSAERDDDHFRKQVALKVVRRGLDTEDVLRRFRHERQILARLEHANIARLLDGGSLPDGRPFFVMEHVDGEPIDAYCASKGLSLRQRLELFRRVCEAVSYAHRNLVVHRDLKPGNIFVTDDGVPKLLDFGIGKVLDTDDGRVTQLHTTEGLLMLTPEYASPEQVTGETLTTLTDVYSLGVLLYRLLTGLPPYALARRRLSEMAETICRTEPRSPSSVVTQDSLVSAGIDEDPRRMRRLLRGDLDTVVLKALSKEPHRRYGSVDELSEDLGRYLDGEPVVARPESLSYRFSKTARRHRSVFAVLAAGLVVLVMVVLFYTFELRSQRDEARSQAHRAEEVSAFLKDMLESSDPGRTNGERVTVRELLGQATQQLDEDLTDQPDIRASLLELIGTINGNLGLFAEAEPLLERAIELRRSLNGVDSPEFAESLAALGDLRYQMGHYREAEQLLTESLELRRALLGPEDPALGKTLNDLGAVVQALGRTEEAEERYRSALRLQRKVLGNDHKETLITQANLAALLYGAGRLDQAEDLCRRTLVTQRRVLGENHPDLAITENTLAAVLVAKRRYPEATELMRDSLDRQKAYYGEQHPKVSTLLTNLGALLYFQERYDEAEVNYLQALKVQTATLGEGDLQTVTILINLANLEIHGHRRPAEGVPYLVRAAELQEQLLGPDHASSVKTWLRIVEARRLAGQKAEAGEALERVLESHGRMGEAIPPEQKERAANLRRALGSS